MSKYYAPNYGRLWRKAKRRDRSEGAASPVRHIDPATVDVTKYVQAAKPHRKPKFKSDRVIIPGDGDHCPRCGMPMEIREHADVANHIHKSVFYSRWFCCMNDRCQTREVMPERYKVVKPVILGDSWDDMPVAVHEQPPWEV